MLATRFDKPRMFTLFMIIIFSVIINLFTQNYAEATNDIFEITTNDTEVNSTSCEITGTASDIKKPMWYEIYYGNDEEILIDYGSFHPENEWCFKARHLRTGKNVVKVFAQNKEGEIFSDKVNLTLEVGEKSQIRPRPRPAELWWGGTARNQQLAEPDAKWDFVKKYADGYFFHSAAWSPSLDYVASSIAEQLAPYGTKLSVELGGGMAGDNYERPQLNKWPNWQFNAWGAGGGFLTRLQKAGVVFDEITHDFHPQDIYYIMLDNPKLTEKEAVTKLTDLWRHYILKNYEVYPNLKTGHTNSPVWWAWKDYTALRGKSDNNLRHVPLKDFEGLKAAGITLEFKYKGESSSYSQGLHVNLRKEAPFQIYSNIGYTISFGTPGLVIFDNGVQNKVDLTDKLGKDFNYEEKFHEIKIKLYKNTLKVYIDEKLCYSKDDLDYQKKGYINFFGHDSEVQVKDVVAELPEDENRTTLSPDGPFEISTKNLKSWMVNKQKNNVEVIDDNVLKLAKGMVALAPVKYKYNPIEVDGEVVSVNFNMYDIMKSLNRMTNDTGRPWIWYSDVPYYTLTWNGVNSKEGKRIRAKIRAYEQWLHSVDALHTFVANEDPGRDLADRNPDKWHEKFTEHSLKSMQLHQKTGGRADRYLLESWYSSSEGWMPSRVVPEDEPYTYTNLTKKAIKYLKGINDDGTYQKLKLSVKESDEDISITLSNEGNVACLPALLAFEEGDSNITTKWFDADKNEITEEINSKEGWVPSELLNPGKTITITSEVNSNRNSDKKEYSIEAFWNPQDPSGLVRDRKTWSIEK